MNTVLELRTKIACKEPHTLQQSH